MTGSAQCDQKENGHNDPDNDSCAKHCIDNPLPVIGTGGGVWEAAGLSRWMMVSFYCIHMKYLPNLDIRSIENLVYNKRYISAHGKQDLKNRGVATRMYMW